ncbi:MAG: hypothetical protein IKN43_10965 [Selenomonadaceae bacterium]|nr:hypothetical protein [Selenomonadaceae bacterium]
MDNEVTKPPKMLTIREIAKLGVLPEHALRIMLKAGQLPALYVGKKALVNYDKLCDLLHNLNAASPISQFSK